MAQKLIDGVRVKQLKVIPDERGRLMEMLRRDDEVFLEFGQTYLTTMYPGVTKAWHYHKLQHDNFVCVRGMIKLVLFDERDGSPTRGTVNEFFLGDHNAQLVVIPPNVWHGFKNIGETESLIVNIVTKPYDYQSPDEYRLPAHENHIPYDWARKDG
ncbi:dTDP-4-dehydrorhamnose 3,5-epimerase family protein [Anaeromyxobacter paludicola]|uniref:dTDP-4-dehydrorhamnose 3,5-epimerase n=1 Tax=Anaeromyxobacter paludicola TaxID=2918171 RepID=A0ABM7X5U9_9BACT|nr:dTDP-4-dehydrorhamnose 3,5-epimerase family protein [Anaeromyxobacter paludicola]BDG07186.1 dTDP-4-dehydrorhamnose 3,5-epimerase [Anaeromyxobacter paludicola]